MRVLSNGQVEITNSDTGEKKIVGYEELSSYGVSSPSNYTQLVEQAKQNEVSSISGASPLPVIGDKTGLDINAQTKKAYQDKWTANPSLRDTIANQYKTATGEDLFAPTDIKAETEVSDILNQKKLQSSEMQNSIDNIDTVLNKDLKYVVGLASPLALIPGTSAFNTKRQIQQIKDQLSLASVGKLKGQGSVSDAERAMLSNASTALSMGMSEKAFRDELIKVKGILQKTMAINQGNEGVVTQTNIQNDPYKLPLTGNGTTQPPKSTGDPATDKFRESDLLAKQAIKETDPAKKQTLLEQSRILAAEGRGIDENRKQPSTLLKGAAKVQDIGANTEALPIIYSILGRAISGGTSAGAGLGAAGGQALKLTLKKGGVKSLYELPTIGEVGSIALKGAEYYALDKIFTAGSKFVSEAWQAKTLNPGKIASFMREKVTEITPTLDVSKIIEVGDRWARLDPASADIWEELKPALTQNMPTKDLLDMLTGWGGRTWNLMGNQKDKAASELMKHIYGAGRDVILEQAPQVAEYTASLKNIKDLPGVMKGVQKGTWLLLKLFGIGKLAGI